MTRLYVKLQTPTIEIKVKAKDSSGMMDKLTVGFKRYEATESAHQLKLLQGLFEDQVGKDNDDIDTAELDSFIKGQIVYILQANLILVGDDGKESSLSVLDTRKAKPVADRWESSEDCLDVLLDLYLASSPWRSAFNDALQKALVNMEYVEGAIKN